MSVLEHLKELRTRLVISVAALLVGFAIAVLVPLPSGAADPTQIIVPSFLGTTTIASEVVRLLLLPVEGHVQAIRPAEVLFTFFKIALFTGAAIAMPVIVYQIMLFVLPALLPDEKRYLYMALPGVSLSFVIGAAFSYVVLIPFAVKFLLGFGAELVEQKWTLEEYLDLVSHLMFYMGVAFEMPLIIFFLSKIGVVNVKRLTSMRRYVLVLAFVVGAFITPTPDPFNQLMVSVPLYALFELGILLARLA